MEIVLLENLPAFIEKVITSVCKGQALANNHVDEHGITIMKPESIDFTLVVVEKWQDESLEILSSQSSETVTTRGGKTTESSSESGTLRRTTSSQQYREGARAYNQNGSGTSTYT